MGGSALHAVVLCNNLPADLVNVFDLDSFKKGFSYSGTVDLQGPETSVLLLSFSVTGHFGP